MTVFDCSIVELPKYEDRAGNLTPVYGSINIPFDMIYLVAKHVVRMPIKNVINFW